MQGIPVAVDISDEKVYYFLSEKLSMRNMSEKNAFKCKGLEIFGTF